jgi:DNA polymerase I-like protein with 3'-5' exonuclease and polymerase domains
MIYLVNDTLQRDNFNHIDMEEVVSYCKDKSILSVDTETTGLDYTIDRVILFQIGDEEKQFLIETRGHDIQELKEILESKTITKIFHNAKFDVNFIRSSFNIVCENVYDTMLAEKILTCGKGLSVSLLNTLERNLKITMDKTQQSSFVGHTGDFTDPQLIYAAKDVEYLIDLKDKQDIKTEIYKLQNTIDLENEVVLAFADIEYNGLELDSEEWLKLANNAINKADEYEVELDKHVMSMEELKQFIPKHIQGDLFSDVSTLRKVNVKWTSPKQVLEVLRGIIPKLDNVNGKDMLRYAFQFDIVATYIKYKEQMKIYSSYGEKFMTNLKSDGKIHTSFNQILDTGRVSSSRPNMQQIPADNAFRNCFIAPEGWSFVSADYSSQELNVIAYGSKDPVWIEALIQGKDLHSVCAELVYGSKWTDVAEADCSYMKDKSKCNCKAHKKLRTNVKTINFGLAYGMGANKLSETLQIDKKAAEQLIEDYFTAFPSIKGFLDKLANFGKQFGYIKTFPPYNRKRWFTNWYPKIWNSKAASLELGSIERASKNTPIQGASADMTKRALVLMRGHIAGSNAPVKLVMTVHDQIDTICKNEYLDKWTVIMKKIMEYAAKEIVTNGLLKADVTVSNCWEK